MNFWSKVKLSDFLLLYFTDLLGKYLSGQIYTFSSISIACASIFFYCTCLFILAHLCIPAIIKKIKKTQAKNKKQNVFLGRIPSPDLTQNSFHDADYFFTKMKLFLRKTLNIFAYIIVGYFVVIFVKWILPYSNLISDFGVTTVLIIILSRYGYFQAILANNID